MDFLEAAKWRYATKVFDSSKQVSAADLAKLRTVANLSPTSYGLQLFKILEIPKGEIRTKLRAASWNQAQVEDASELFVLCVPTQVTEADIAAHVALRETTLELPVGTMKGYGDFIQSKLGDLPDEAIQHWMAKQTYIVLGNLMSACAALQIDACPMEGFSASEYDTILGLNDKGLMATVVLAIGYRSEKDETAKKHKVRKQEAALFERVSG